MIPKHIHYFWFGPNKLDDISNECIKSWEKNLNSFQIHKWNEENFKYKNFSFTKKVYEERKWAFVSDYARLRTLYENGGIYLDTDMLILKDISPLLDKDLVLGEEESGIISAGMIASAKGHPFIKKALDYYDANPNELITIPRILTKVWQEYPKKEDVRILSKEFFYPYNSEEIKSWDRKTVPNNCYGVHMWNYSWGSPINKFFKNVGIYSFGKKMSEILGIKKLLKKIFGFV